MLKDTDNISAIFAIYSYRLLKNVVTEIRSAICLFIRSPQRNHLDSAIILEDEIPPVFDLHG